MKNALFIAFRSCLAPACLVITISIQADVIKTERNISMITNIAEAINAVGTIVRFTGVARDAKLSAIVAGEEITIYCVNRKKWQPHLIGKTITVEGMLEYSNRYMAWGFPAEVSKPGTDGKIFFITDSSLMLDRSENIPKLKNPLSEKDAVRIAIDAAKEDRFKGKSFRAPYIEEIRKVGKDWVIKILSINPDLSPGVIVDGGYYFYAVIDEDTGTVVKIDSGGGS